MMRPPSTSVIAVFKREEWDDLREVCADLPETYDAWWTGVLEGLAAMELLPENVTKVVLSADQLRRLYEARGRGVTLKDRARLAARLELEMRRAGTRH